jgi:hypothetical protein
MKSLRGMIEMSEYRKIRQLLSFFALKSKNKAFRYENFALWKIAVRPKS